MFLCFVFFSLFVSVMFFLSVVLLQHKRHWNLAAALIIVEEGHVQSKTDRTNEKIVIDLQNAVMVNYTSRRQRATSH